MKDFDPFAIHDPFASIGKIPGLDDGGMQRQRAEFRRPLPPEQSASIGQQALDAGSSGLKYVLDAIAKPKHAVTGLLAGQGASALKNLVPFSETMGLTDAKNNVEGRDITDMYGLTDKGDKGWGAWGAGLAADIALDPLTFASFGPKHALTGAGKALEGIGATKGWSREALMKGFDATESGLKAAGRSPSEITHMLDQGKRIATPAMEAAGAVPGKSLAGLLNVGVPFGPKATLGTGEWAQPIARRLDKAGDFLRYKVPGAKTMGALFDNLRGGAVDELTQKGWEKYGHEAMEAGSAAGRTDVNRVLQQLDPLIKKHGQPLEATVTDAARAVGEGVPHDFPANIAADVTPVGLDIRGIGQRQFGEARQAGVPLGNSVTKDPYASYVHRQAMKVNQNDLQIGGKGATNQYPVTSGSSLGREDVLTGIPGGTPRLNDWFSRFAGKDPATSMPLIRADLENDLIKGGGAMSPAMMTEFDDKAIALAERMKGANPLYSSGTKGVQFFSPDIVGDLKQRAGQATRTVASAKAATGTLADAAQPFVAGEHIPLPKALAQLGIKTYPASTKAGTAMQGGLVELYRKLAPKGAGMVDPYLMGKRADLAQEVAKYGIRPEDLQKITKAYGKWAAPEEIKAPLKFLDSWTNAFKGLAYPMWIPSHVRNAATATANNARRGVTLGDYLDQLQEMTGRGSRDLSGIHSSLAGLSPADQIEQLRGLKYGAANIYGHAGMNEEIVGNVKNRVLRGIQDDKRFTPFVPGSDRSGKYGNVLGDTADLVLNQGLLGSLKASGNAVKDSVLGLFDKSRLWGQGIGENLGIKGVGGAEADLMPAVKAGRMAGTNIEDFFRGAQVNRELRNGLSPEMAAEQMNRLHFDYDALTSFEKSWMRRAVPFYTFARRNIPLQFETLATQPGVIANQYKPFYQGRKEEGYVPQYLASGAAVPVGEEHDGHRQYLSKFGLPAEEAFEKLHFKNGLPDVGNTVLDFMSTLNPIVKAPLEQLFDTQFHTQRKLSDLKAPQAASALGRVFGDDNPQLLGQVMANSPLTRFFTSADKLFDSRKGIGQKLLNLGTGVRVTDVDTDRQRAIETRAALEQIMAGHPTLSQFTNFYVKPEDISKLTPDEIAMMRKYTELQDAAKKYAKQKREAIGVPGAAR